MSGPPTGEPWRGSVVEPASRRAADFENDLADAFEQRRRGARDQPVARTLVRRAAAIDRIAFAGRVRRIPARSRSGRCATRPWRSRNPVPMVSCSALSSRLPTWPQSSPSAACRPISSLSRSGSASAARYARPTAVRLRFMREPISRRDTSTAERGRIASITTMSRRSRTARWTDNACVRRVRSGKAARAPECRSCAESRCSIPAPTTSARSARCRAAGTGNRLQPESR